MADVDEGFEEFRRDLIAHLSARTGLAPEVAASQLNAWLLERGRAPAPEGRRLTLVPPPRTRR